jgi:hypothetical protein
VRVSAASFGWAGGAARASDQLLWSGLPKSECGRGRECVIASLKARSLLMVKRHAAAAARSRKCAAATRKEEEVSRRRGNGPSHHKTIH